MHQLFRSHSDYFHRCLNNYRNPFTSLILVSKFHSSPETQSPNSKLDFVSHEADSLGASQFTNSERRNDSRLAQGYQVNLQVTHPWPEWVNLMELLFKRGYFEHTGNPFLNSELGTKETNWIRTACLNFARDQSPLIRLFSRKDIHMIAVRGCPSIDRKVVNSGKRLRAHVGIDEGNVCSACNLRGDCERAYVKAREEEGGRTVDVMRFLLTYGLETISGKSGNRLSQNRMVKESVRMLLKEMVDFSSQQCDSGEETGSPFSQNHLMKQGDWFCPKCNFLNFAKNIRCKRCDGLFEEKLKQLREDQNHLPLKKGDWICETCNFLNFAKNTRCLQCKEKPPKRHINPGEWECESCNYINFRRNMVCLKCDHRRPKAFTATNNNANKFNNDIPIGQDGTKNRSDAKRWRFLEEENGGNRVNSRDKKAGFIDFPIVGGKSSLSRDEEEREKWKLEMLKRSKTGTKANEELRNMEVTRQSIYVETSDEDMVEWFGCSKKMG